MKSTRYEGKKWSAERISATEVRITLSDEAGDCEGNCAFTLRGAIVPPMLAALEGSSNLLAALAESSRNGGAR